MSKSMYVRLSCLTAVQSQAGKPDAPCFLLRFVVLAWLGIGCAAGLSEAASPSAETKPLQAGVAVANITPWLGGGDDTSTDPGFQGNFSTLWASAASPQTGTTGTSRNSSV